MIGDTVERVYTDAINRKLFPSFLPSFLFFIENILSFRCVTSCLSRCSSGFLVWTVGYRPDDDRIVSSHKRAHIAWSTRRWIFLPPPPPPPRIFTLHSRWRRRKYNKRRTYRGRAGGIKLSRHFKSIKSARVYPIRNQKPPPQKEVKFLILFLEIWIHSKHTQRDQGAWADFFISSILKILQKKDH